MKSGLTSNMADVITLMGGGRMPLLKPAVNATLLMFLIPTAPSLGISMGTEEFETTWMKYFQRDADERKRGITPLYCTTRLGNVELENLVRDWMNFGHLIPKKCATSTTKNSMTWDFVSDDGSEYFSKYFNTNPPQGAIRISSSEVTWQQPDSIDKRHVMYIRSAFEIQNLELLCYNDVQYLLKSPHLHHFRVVFIPFAPHNISCWMNKLKCNGCPMSGLCDMGQVPIGFLSISRDAVDNPVYTARAQLCDVSRIKNINRIRMPKDMLLNSLPKLSGDLSSLSTHDQLALKDNILPSSQEGFIKVVIPKSKVSYTHAFTFEARSGHIQSNIESVIDSEGSEDARLVLAHRGMFDYLPKLKEVF